MLGYVFFHRRASGSGIDEYEDALRRFHSALAAAAPAGFQGSTSYRIGGGYADWYLVDDSAALDALNAAAVGATALSRHDAVAQMSTDGAGKLFSLVSGQPSSRRGIETRFAKPRGVAYPDFYERLREWTERPDVSLWRRMLVLGPGPEFCLISASEVELPADVTPETLPRQPV
ncbi:MAG TPA: hypothetical protein VGG90_01600 [Candidatus Dormibacteraeota bacterium]